MRQDSLEARISQGKELTEDEQDKLVDLLGARCQAGTKRRLARALRCVPDIPSYGIYARVHLDGGPSYCAGQSYTDEIRTVRELLIGKRS